LKTTIGIAATSPRLIEYGKLVDTKNGWNTFNFAASFVRPKPERGLSEKPVMIHEVMVSGTFFVITFPDVSLNKFKNY
jgi:hypothetical protein